MRQCLVHLGGERRHMALDLRETACTGSQTTAGL